jgi:hypothetical protein
VNECDLGLHACHTSAACVETIGSYECECEEGYALASNVWCNDINECIMDTHNCHAKSTCSNTDGSWECVSNRAGRVLIFFEIDMTDRTAFSAVTVASQVHAALSLSAEDRVYAVLRDLDRRRSDPGIVDITVETNSSELDLTDPPLPDGMSMGSEPTSFEMACNTGYWGDGETCSDIDECSLNDPPCTTHGVCVNNEGSFVCNCDSGYVQRQGECVVSQSSDSGTFAIVISAGVAFGVPLTACLLWGVMR